jgi:hypothetical protein
MAADEMPAGPTMMPPGAAPSDGGRPIRHGRMIVSPLASYRGAAKIVAIVSYLGNGAGFERATLEFSNPYADQNGRADQTGGDYRRLVKAVKSRTDQSASRTLTPRMRPPHRAMRWPRNDGALPKRTSSNRGHRLAQFLRTRADPGRRLQGLLELLGVLF